MGKWARLGMKLRSKSLGTRSLCMSSYHYFEPGNVLTSFRYRAGLKEVQILNKLKQADPEDKKHVVRLERTFEHRGHLCLVFESLR